MTCHNTIAVILMFVVFSSTCKFIFIFLCPFYSNPSFVMDFSGLFSRLLGDNEM